MASVKVTEKNAGAKIAYEQDGTKITFGDEELMVNAAKYQRDWPVQIDVCADENGSLVIGTGTGRYYVAQLDIPATAYEEAGAEEEAARTALPLDMADVTLTLWSVDDLEKAL